MSSIKCKYKNFSSQFFLCFAFESILVSPQLQLLCTFKFLHRFCLHFLQLLMLESTTTMIVMNSKLKVNLNQYQWNLKKLQPFSCALCSTFVHNRITNAFKSREEKREKKRKRKMNFSLRKSQGNFFLWTFPFCWLFSYAVCWAYNFSSFYVCELVTRRLVTLLLPFFLYYKPIPIFLRKILLCSTHFTFLSSINIWSISSCCELRTENTRKLCCVFSVLPALADFQII